MKNDVLGFDYEPIQGQRLVGALGNAPLVLDDGSVAFDKVSLILESCSLLFSVDADTDEVACNQVKGDPRQSVDNNLWVNIDALVKYVGSESGWLWLGNNWMGYNDMITISFSGIDPSIALVGVASKINLYQLHKIGSGYPVN